MILPFRTFDANGTTLVRIFYKHVVKIFTLLTDHLTYGHHFNLSGTSRATIEQFHRFKHVHARVHVGEEDVGEKSSVALTGFGRGSTIREVSTMRSLHLSSVSRHSKRDEGRLLGVPFRPLTSRRDQNINHAQHPRTICPTTYPALPSHCSRSTSATACSVLLEETQSQPGELS